MFRPAHAFCSLLLFLAAAPLASAQDTSAADEFLRYVPKDTSLCFVLNGLRGQAARWQKSPWLHSPKIAARAQASPILAEFKNLLKLQVDLKKNLDIDWPTLRDEVLGDAVVFAFQPGPAARRARRAPDPTLMMPRYSTSSSKVSIACRRRPAS